MTRSGLSAWQRLLAARALRAGGVVAYPTEAVFGLGCLPDRVDALERLLRLKQRPVRKGLIVIASRAAQLEGLVLYPSSAARERVLGSWPGPHTWLLPMAVRLPLQLTGDHRTLAVRVTAHPVAAALCEEVGPLVSTSANPSGRPPARSALEVRRYFGAAVDRVVPGEVGAAGAPTEIRDAVSGRLVRPGPRA